MPDLCGNCNNSIDRRKSSYISCAGFCCKQYHCQCVGITGESLQALKTPGFCWYCTDCFKIRNKYENFMKNFFETKISNMMGEFETMFEDLKVKIMDMAESKLSSVCHSNNIPVDKPVYSQIVGSKSTLVIKPIDSKQPNNKTKTDIMKNIDPVNLKLHVTQIKNVKDGGILIGCDDAESANNFKKVATQKLSSQYKISDVKKFQPKIKIVGLMSNFEDEELVKYLKGQNDIISENSFIKVLKVWATKNNSNIFQSVVEVDAATYGLIMSRGKLFVNYDVCTVYDATNIRVCYKCSGYNHGQSNCPSDVSICPKCSGDHRLSECNSDVFKCINCKNAKLDDINHTVWDVSKCPIYQKRLSNLKASTFITK